MPRGVHWLLLATVSGRSAGIARAQCTPTWTPTFTEEAIGATGRAIASFDPDGPGPLPAILVAGGEFTTVGTRPVNYVAYWDGNAWQQLGAGLSGPVYGLTSYDDDGPGPNPPRLAAAGSFAGASLAFWNGTAWTLQPGTTNDAHALLEIDEDGPGPMPPSLVIAGYSNFVLRQGVLTALGTAVGSPVETLAAFDDDGSGPAPPRIYAGGGFTSIGGVAAPRLARWNGQAWDPVGGGVSGNRVFALKPYDPDGTGQNAVLIVGGDFSSAGGAPASLVAAWTGASWTAMPGLGTARVEGIGVYTPAGPAPQPSQLVVSGAFSVGSGASSGTDVARWDGAHWQPMGVRWNGPLLAMCTHDPDGAGPAPAELVGVGSVTGSSGGPAAYWPRAARWDGSAWAPLGTAQTNGLDDFPLALASHDEDGPGPRGRYLFAGGRFRTAGGAEASHLARWDGYRWSPLGIGVNNEVTSLVSWDPDGPGPTPARLIVGGRFTGPGATYAGVAMWDGNALTVMGPLPVFGPVALAVFDADGAGPGLPALFAGTPFSDGTPCLLRWTGDSWEAVPGAPTFDVNALAVYDPDGPGPLPAALVVGGDFSGPPGQHIAQWNGSAWSALGPGLNGEVNCLASYDEDGAGPQAPVLMAAGGFSSSGSTDLPRVARWNGSAWSRVGTAFSYPNFNGVNAMVAVDQPGSGPEAAPTLYIAGSFNTTMFPPGTTLRGIARWNGSQWTAVSGGVNDSPKVLALHDDGNGPALFVGGRISITGAVSAANIGRFGCEPPRCYADCDHQPGPPSLSVSDFTCFLTRFAAADPWANCDGSTQDPALNIADFTCFLQAFATGCP